MSWPRVQKGTTPSALDWSAELELGDLPQGNAFSLSSSGQGPVVSLQSQGEMSLKECSEKHSFLQVSQGSMLFNLVFPPWDQPGFQMFSQGRLLASGKPLLSPSPRPWQAATMTSPPPRRALRWEVGMGRTAAHVL